MKSAVVALLLAASAAAQDPRVILLGTGTPNPDPRRSGPAVAIVSGPNVYIVDAGPGVVRRAVEAGIQMKQITRVFITHLHSDHTVGLPDLIFTPAVTGRTGPLDIYGPPGITKMTKAVLEAWSEDIDIRLNGLERSVKEAYVVRPHEIKAGVIFRDSAATVTAFPVPHGSWKHAFGYRFDIDGKSIVISGDTTLSETLMEAARGCDILVHEYYSQKGWDGRTPDWQKYHAAFHTSAPDLGRLAAKVQPKKLVLYHHLPMGQSPEQVLAEVREHFRGEVIYGNDLDVIRP
jgi:ribonuclease BN (tRNA processing enzyme)